MVDLENIIKKTKQGAQNWAIDTSAKVIAYAPLMGAMEAGINYRETGDFEMNEVISTRIGAALIDGIGARIYAKTADYLYNRLNVDPKKGGLKAWAIETGAMVGTYTPIYAGILKLSGDDNNEIGMKLIMGAGIAMATSRLFRKYALTPWRKLWKYKK